MDGYKIAEIARTTIYSYDEVESCCNFIKKYENLKYFLMK